MKEAMEKKYLLALLPWGAFTLGSAQLSKTQKTPHREAAAGTLVLCTAGAMATAGTLPGASDHASRQRRH